ncbi:hypothetical protein CBS11852_11409 [Aspergillus niger]|nr:hypothetical protein CBS11852_11409 [Aspergillus niger]
MASAERPRILLLSLAYRDFLDEVYCTLFSRLSELANIKRAKTANAALQIIGETTFKAIIITDEGLAESNQENQEVLVKIKAYVEKGGIAIVGLHFPNFTPMDKFRRFFEAFGLAWKNGDYHRTTFRLNPSVFLPESIEAASLPGPYSMKVLHVKNAKRQEKIFIPIEGALLSQVSEFRAVHQYVDYRLTSSTDTSVIVLEPMLFLVRCQPRVTRPKLSAVLDGMEQGRIEEEVHTYSPYMLPNLVDIPTTPFLVGLG